LATSRQSLAVIISASEKPIDHQALRGFGSRYADFFDGSLTV
jgi:hypothetical protein